tara:strand:+ start:62 stop:976 length:915 start_codon:yes stop_codon:yes gene_type:complete
VSKKANPVIDGKKECSTCNQIKDVKNFYYDKKVERYKGRCNSCNAYAALQRNRRLGMRPRANPIIDGKKECTKCNQMIEIKYFWKDKGNLRAACIFCKTKENKEWREKNKEKLKLKRKMDWKNMSEAEKQKGYEKLTFWRKNTEGGKKFSERRSKAGLKRYYEIKNDPVAHSLYLEKERKYETERRKNNPQFRFKQNLSRRVRSALTKFKTRKNISTLELTGIKSIQFLMHHIAKQFKPDSEGVPMTWDNYGEWHIDHIKPCSSFDLTCPIQQKLCFHYTNLQPLWAIDNLKKQDKLNYDSKLE